MWLLHRQWWDSVPHLSRHNFVKDTTVSLVKSSGQINISDWFQWSCITLRIQPLISPISLLVLTTCCFFLTVYILKTSMLRISHLRLNLVHRALFYSLNSQFWETDFFCERLWLMTCAGMVIFIPASHVALPIVFKEVVAELWLHWNWRLL